MGIFLHIKTNKEGVDRVKKENRQLDWEILHRAAADFISTNTTEEADSFWEGFHSEAKEKEVEKREEMKTTA